MSRYPSPVILACVTGSWESKVRKINERLETDAAGSNSFLEAPWPETGPGFGTPREAMVRGEGSGAR